MDRIVREILHRRKKLPSSQCMIVGLSGIDASGKSTLAEQLEVCLVNSGLNVTLIHGDGWLNLPEERYSKTNPGEHFYTHGFRFEELFLRLILPLRAQRSLWLKCNHMDQTATQYRQKIYDLRNIDVAILECIFLFQPAFAYFFDLKIWIDCSFETALERGIARGQEGLSPQDTIAAFQQIYFPAQRVHFEKDNPRDLADMILPNDPRLKQPESPSTNRYESRKMQ